MAFAHKQNQGGTHTEAQARNLPPAATTPAASPAVTVAERAYQIWQARGRPNGQDVEHWLQAEREIGAARTGRR